jgi:putative ABC transport system permease protein
MIPKMKALLTSIAATVTLAFWQLRQIWRLFLLTGISMILAVALVCAVPLFGQTAMTSGLQSAFKEDPFTNYINVSSDQHGLSPSTLQEATDVLNNSVLHVAGKYFHSAPDYFLNIQNLPQPLVNGKSLQPGIPHLQDIRLELHGHVFSLVRPALKILEGRLPRPTSASQDLEVALPNVNAELLNVKVGDVLLTSLGSSSGSHHIPLRLTVVGIFDYQQAYDIAWHGDSLTAEINFYTGQAVAPLLVGRDDLLATLAEAEQQSPLTNPTMVRWSYRFDTAPLDIEKVGEVLDQTNHLTTDLAAPLNAVINSQSIRVSATSVTRTLTHYRERTTVTQVPTVLLAALMLGLLLFFLALMTELLMDQQSETLAVIRNRGATIRQITVAFITQSAWLGLIALLCGPLLALPIVQLLARVLLPSSQQSGLYLLAGNPLPIALRVSGYALTAATVAVSAMLLAISRILGSNVLKKGVRAGQRAQYPFWQRFYLDLAAVLVALLSYSVATYLPGTGILDERLRVLIERPAMLVTSIFLLIALVLFFLRLLPRLLALGTRLVLRSRDISPLLPLVLMSRAPRQTIRTALLLTMTIALAMFTLIFTASQARRIFDVADYYSGADFSGSLNSSSELAMASPTQQITAYNSIPGVTTTSVGYTALYNVIDTNASVKLLAVDLETFAQSTIWPQEQSSQERDALLAQLGRQRQVLATFAGDPSQLPIPALVDAACWDHLQLHPGSRIALRDAPGAIPLIVVGKVDHLPTISSELPDSVERAGVLIDYQSYASVYNHLKNIVQTRSGLQFESAPPANYVWLLARHTPAALVSVRQALRDWPFVLNNLNDRLGIIGGLQNDPLVITLMGTLGVVALVPLLLALIGNLVTSWQHVRQRVMGLATLRALGTTRGQLVSLLAWEQGIVYLTAIILGVLAGALLTVVTLPSLIFSDVASYQVMSDADTSIFAFQFAPQLHFVLPLTLLWALLVLVLTCSLALALMIWRVSRFALSPVLRVEESFLAAPPLATVGRSPRVRQQIRPVRGTPARSGRRGLLPAPVAFGLHEMRTSWRYLALTCVGILAAMLIACILPLFTQVTMTAGLRSTLTRPENSYVAANALFNRMLTPLNNARFTVTTSEENIDLNQLFLQENARYFKQPPIFSVEISGDFVSRNYQRQLPDFYSLPVSQASLVHLTQGRFPRNVAAMLEVAVSQEMAAAQHIKVGDRLTPNAHYLSGSMVVVGIFQVPNQQTREPLPPFLAAIKATHLLVSSGAMLPVLEKAFTQIGFQELQEQVLMNWYYPIDGAHLTIDQLEDLTSTMNTLEVDFLRIDPIPLQGIMTPPAIQSYHDSVMVARISLTATAALILGLILLFLGLAANLLVERQASTIAVLRSRGAKRRQIFGSFLAQCITGGLLALFIAPLLSIPTTLLLGRLTLSPVDQHALELLGTPSPSLLWDVCWNLGTTLLIVLMALGIALYRATGTDYLTLRRESARPTQQPLWQRFYLDVVAMLITLTCYAFSRYLTNVQIFTPAVNVLIRTPLILAATISFLCACMLFGLRFLPSLFRLGTRLATRNPGIAPLLAMAQISRSPRRNLQISLLLICSTAFVLFALIFSASQEQYSTDVASYWAGADFSGMLPRDSQLLKLPHERQEAAFQQLNGVKAATTGNVTTLLHFTEGRARTVHILAVEPKEFFAATLWPEQSERQSDELLQRLARASTLSGSNESSPIPALVDEATWNALHLSEGTTFIMQAPFGEEDSQLTFQTIEKIPHIPTLNDHSASIDGDYGIIVDYAMYQKASVSRGSKVNSNFVWLRTNDDPTAISQVRANLNAGLTRLDALIDRRATQEMLRSDPLTISLGGVLLSGILILLFLALIGMLISALQSTRERQTHFSMLRALGTNSRHLGHVLSWEQGIQFVTSLVLGIILGLVFTLMTLSILIPPGNILGTLDTQGTTSDASIQSITDVFTLQNVPPVTAVFPSMLLPVLGVLVAMGVLTVIVVLRLTMRTRLGEILRLNED